MSDATKSHNLDPKVLDDIVRNLDLQEASALERLQLWYRDFLNTAWDWLTKLTGGKNGWLEKAANRVSSWFSELSGGEPISADGVINVVTLVTVGLVAIGVAYLCYRLWQLYQPLESAQQTEASYLLTDLELKKPLDELRPDQWAPALLSQVCMTLVSHDRLQLFPNSTNAAIAQQADLAESLRVELQALAEAADRSLFAGWVPDNQAAARLRNHRNNIVSAVACKS